MTFTLGLAGDTMLGRGVARRLVENPGAPLFAPEVVDAARGADLLLLNLECCVSDRGQRWPDPRKPFFFRAPPSAVDRLRDLGVDAVSLANNHALDFGTDALLDTIEHLRRGGIAAVGAGADVDAARRALALESGGLRIGVVAVADHPAGYAAAAGRAGIAFAELRRGVPDWLTAAVAGVDADATLVLPHWGPNMVPAPVGHVRAAGRALLDAGATVVAGHSAHVFHGAAFAGHALLAYDLGDFIDDYAVDDRLRNDLGLLWLVEVDEHGPRRVEAVPLALDFCFTRLAEGAERAWIARRLRRACAEFDTTVSQEGDRLVLTAAG